MSSELLRLERPLFGGAISSSLSQRFTKIRGSVCGSDPSRDESLIFELLLDFKTDDVGDSGSASWFLHDLAREQDADVEAFKMITRLYPKEDKGQEAQNLVRVYVANLRLKGVETDVLVPAYEPFLINPPLSESANAVGSGLAVPASQSGVLPMCDVIKQALSTFKVNDWSLFGSSSA